MSLSVGTCDELVTYWECDLPPAQWHVGQAPPPAPLQPYTLTPLQPRISIQEQGWEARRSSWLQFIRPTLTPVGVLMFKHAERKQLNQGFINNQSNIFGFGGISNWNTTLLDCNKKIPNSCIRNSKRGFRTLHSKLEGSAAVTLEQINCHFNYHIWNNRDVFWLLSNY